MADFQSSALSPAVYHDDRMIVSTFLEYLVRRVERFIFKNSVYISHRFIILFLSFEKLEHGIFHGPTWRLPARTRSTITE